MKNKITVKRKIHAGWKQSNQAFLNNPDINPEFKKHIMGLFGKYQYMYKSKKGEISLIFLNYGTIYDKPFWEIFSTKGELFFDVMRFNTKEEAEKTIYKLLA